MSYIFI